MKCARAKDTISFRRYYRIFSRHADRWRNKTTLYSNYSSGSIEYTVGSKATTDNVSANPPHSTPACSPPSQPTVEIRQIPESGLPRAG